MKIKLGLMFTAAFAANCVAGLAQTNSAVSKPAASTVLPASDASVVAATPGSPGEVMPLVVIEDASLPDAIRNLARLANLNIQFDPKAIGTNVPPTISFRWENITAEQALQAVLDNYGLQLAQDPKTRISRVTTKDPAALEPLISRVILLKYTNPTNVVPVVKATFTTPRSQVLADSRTGQLVVIATEKEMATIEDVLQRLDTSPAQILIEARFMEASKNPKSAKGIDWSGTLAANSVSFGNNSLFSRDTKTDSGLTQDGRNGNLATFPSPKVVWGTTGGLGPIGFLNSDGLNAVVSFLNSDSQTETLSTPRAVALEGVPTELSVVQNIPIFEQEQGQATAAGVSPITVKPKYDLIVGGTTLNEVGTKLIVTPRIYGVTNVMLDLKPELSEKGPNERQVLNNVPSEAPTFIRRKIQTQALVPSGQTLVLGGLREDRNTKDLTKVPVLGDLPGLGRAFRSDIKTKQNRQLLIFVTPTILSQDDYIASPEARDFLKQKPVERPDVPAAPYDSADPKDWTTPMP